MSRIGVYVCHCGGNISDYVDVDKVITAIADEGDVVVAKTAMFNCSDATQQEMISDIESQQLDGLVFASCSPKLHTYTFRGVATRAGLNPYEYTQVNIREQCSWVHTDDEDAATEKATSLVLAGVAVPADPGGLGLAFGAAERVDRLADHYVGETAVLQHLPPARTGQPAGNSTSPQVDVAQRLDHVQYKFFRCRGAGRQSDHVLARQPGPVELARICYQIAGNPALMADFAKPV